MGVWRGRGGGGWGGGREGVEEVLPELVALGAVSLSEKDECFVCQFKVSLLLMGTHFS